MGEVCQYPIVFVHGVFGWGCDEGIDKKMPYWGATTGSLTDYLAQKGYECYSASVGPISSAWDRACELYARLTGTVVDYGKAHAEKAGHRRFGRKYEEPLVSDWGSERKMHLIGHSFGGNTIRLLVHLLTYGDPTEQAATQDGTLSPLFTGGKGDWVRSIVTICAPHNGTSAIGMMRKYKIMRPAKAVVYNYAGIVGRTQAQGGMVDFHMEQYGLSDTPGKQDAFPLGRAKKQIHSHTDCLEFDLSVHGAAQMNGYVRMNPQVYYFSYYYNAVAPTKSGKHNLPSEADFPVLKATSSAMLLYGKNNADCVCYNDGLVDVQSAQYPAGEPHCVYDAQRIEPGIWNVMPERTGDHGTPIGLFADEEETHRLYLDMLQMLQEIE
ncbi:MAG: esterase/lipase family protein [Acutalibacteraceae bacterium]